MKKKTFKSFWLFQCDTVSSQNCALVNKKKNLPAPSSIFSRSCSLPVPS